jgi:hypothetical protein
MSERLQISKNITAALVKELELATKIIMQAYKLGDSDVIESVIWEYNNNAFILWAYDYFQWIISGRRPMAKKIPVEALLKWMKKKNIIPTGRQTYNSLAYTIQNSIYKAGIKIRPFGSLIITASMDLISDKLAEDLLIQITDGIAYEMTMTLGS